MRSQKALISLLILVFSSLATAAHALTITANGVGVGQSLTAVNVGGVLTTIVDFSAGVTVAGTPAGTFTISGKATAEQSGSEERILFQNMSITAVGCSTATPCSLALTAQSDGVEFQAKAPGGYPSTVLINASITGPAGDQISATGETNRIDIINADVGGTGVSVPWVCTGKPTCTFTTIGDPTADVFGDTGSKTIQLPSCGFPTCAPFQKFTINMTFVGTTVNIPIVGAAQSSTGSAAPLLGTVPALSGTSLTLSNTTVAITPLPGPPTLSNASFAVGTRFAARGGVIDPLTQTVRFSVGTYLVSIDPGSFRPIFGGKFFFFGVVGGVELAVLISPLSGGNWAFDAGGLGANLSGTMTPVPVGLQIGGQQGATWASPLSLPAND